MCMSFQAFKHANLIFSVGVLALGVVGRGTWCQYFFTSLDMILLTGSIFDSFIDVTLS